MSKAYRSTSSSSKTKATDIKSTTYPSSSVRIKRTTGIRMESHSGSNSCSDGAVIRSSSSSRNGN